MNRILFFSLFFLFSYSIFCQSIVSVEPDEAELGENLAVTVTGENTSWTQSSNVLFFSQGTTTIYASPQAVVNDTVIEGQFSFYYWHPDGYYDVEVEEIASGTAIVLEDGFLLNEGEPPVITAVVPDSGLQTTYVSITVSGENTQFTQGSHTLNLKGDFDIIYPEEQTVYSDTVIEGEFFINPDHYPGLYDVRITAAPSVILEDGFTVLEVEDPPELIAIIPDSAYQGETAIVTITGLNTHFDHPDLEINVMLDADNASAIPAEYVNVVDSVTLEAWFSFDHSNLDGLYYLRVYDQLDGTMLLEDAFLLLPGSGGPQIVSVDPDDAEQDQTLWVTVTGQNTFFTSGTATMKFRQGSSTIYPTGQNVINDTVIEGDFSFTIEHKEGYYDVMVFDLNGNWEVSKSDAFYLYPYVSVDEYPESSIGQVYPNPATSLLFIKRNNQLQAGIAIDILNMAGEIIYIDEMTGNQQVKSIDVTNIEAGVYLIHLRSPGRVHSEKIVIK
jgi:hypothetical protein